MTIYDELVTGDKIRKLEAFLRNLQLILEGLPALDMDPAAKFAFSPTSRGLEALRKWVEARLAELRPAAAATAAVPSPNDGEDNSSYRDGCMF